MATEPNPEKQPGDAQRSRVGRSPAYPWVDLAGAVDMAKKVYNSQRRQEAHISATLQALGYSGDSGSSRRAISALKQYGLTQETGEGENRRVRLSDMALDLVLLPNTDARWPAAARAAALSPTIYAMLWERYGKILPDTQAITPYLIRDKGYNESAAEEIVENYRSTFELANLGKMDEPSPDDSEKHTGGRQNTAPADSGRKPDEPLFTPVNADPLAQEMPILVGPGKVARIPFPMAEEDFNLFIGTLNLWKSKLVAPPQPKRETTHEVNDE